MNSLSKGVFVFKNGMNGKLNGNKRKGSQITDTKFSFGNNSRYWNAEFENTWQTIQSKVDAFRMTNDDIGLTELLDFVDKSYSDVNNDAIGDVSGSVYLPVASLLTGINKPDHHQYFKNLCDKLTRRNGTHTIVLPARDCPNLKSTIEILVSCVLNKGRKHNYQDDEEAANRSFLGDDSHEDSEPDSFDMTNDADEPPIKLRRSQYTLNVLLSWYAQRYSGHDSNKSKICIIIPNFEEFKPMVIVDLISILSNHCHELPFVLILGVATTTASIFHTLSFTETTRIKLHAFSSLSPVGNLNRILDDIILTPRISFHLSANIFSYLTSVFIYYDLTASEFLRALRVCMLTHYSQGAAYAVCTPSCVRSMETIKKMSGNTNERISHEEIEQIRRLLSFRPYVNGLSNEYEIIAILTDDEFFMNALGPIVRNVYCYFMKFHCFMRVLMILVKDLPHAPLGKHLRDIYPHCIGGNRSVIETEEFEKCWQYLALMSKQEIAKLLQKCCSMMLDYLAKYCSVNDRTVDRYVAEDTRKCVKQTIQEIVSFIENLSNDGYTNNSELTDLNTSFSNDSQQKFTRLELKQKMLEKAQQLRSERSNELKKVLDYLRESVFGKYVLPFCKGPPLIELFVFSNESVRSMLKGAPRGSIHIALTNPQYYLQCNCCAVDVSHALAPTMPDISIAYKLLLECGQHVNLFDWLQAFKIIVDPDNADDDEIPPVIQARFTRARAELQFLGFIKSSKRKTDHITRTTW